MGLHSAVGKTSPAVLVSTRPPRLEASHQFGGDGNLSLSVILRAKSVLRLVPDRGRVAFGKGGLANLNCLRDCGDVDHCIHFFVRKMTNAVCYGHTAYWIEWLLEAGIGSGKDRASLGGYDWADTFAGLQG